MDQGLPRRAGPLHRTGDSRTPGRPAGRNDHARAAVAPAGATRGDPGGHRAEPRAGRRLGHVNARDRPPAMGGRTGPRRTFGTRPQRSTGRSRPRRPVDQAGEPADATSAVPRALSTPRRTPCRPAHPC
ncbi:hypothetical protein SGPA1_40307 [Streptomyces misionensis JCM 4497]